MWGVFNRQLRGNGLWVTAFIGATLYQFYWDVAVDWGLVIWYVTRL